MAFLNIGVTFAIFKLVRTIFFLKDLLKIVVNVSIIFLISLNDENIGHLTNTKFFSLKPIAVGL